MTYPIRPLRVVGSSGRGPLFASPREIGAPYEGDPTEDRALRKIALRIVGGDPADADERLRAAIAEGDASLFVRIATTLATEAPFDGSFVGRSLARLYAGVIDHMRAADARIRAENRALAQVARRDPLTGVPGRAKTEELLTTEMRRSERYGTPFSLLFVDVDQLKSVNQTHGRAIGDLVLRHLVATIASSLRPGDHFGRHGGEEFLVGLANAGARAAVGVAERLRMEVEGARIEGRFGRLGVTVSIGVATRRAGEAAMHSLLERADRAMLAAKANGRNAVYAAEPGLAARGR